MTAVDLLTAYSGENAAQYRPFFLFSEESRIVGVEVHAVGTDSTTVRYSGQEVAKKEVNNILRITTADGFEGVSGVDTFHEGQFSDEHLLELQDTVAKVITLQSLDPVEVGEALEQIRPGLSDAVRSSIDIALWDLAARKADRPLYELLGAKRNSMEAYASFPFYESLPEYVDAVYQYAKLGYATFKFHVWGSIEEDIRLVESLQQTFADSDCRFMIDLEEKYDLEDALRLGKQMNEGLFVWMEAAIGEENLSQYAELRSRLSVQIIPDGYSFYSPEFISQGIEAGSWDAGRFDVTKVGGISKALELLMIANDAGMAAEIQSWGHSLAQAVNLHLALANARTRYFEAPTPTGAFEFGMKNGILLNRGRVVAPDGPGLGIQVDWERLDSADFYVYSNPDISVDKPL
jgi:L-alanine-DL-glutamate epimerase-like enolase superfamily enzyme